MIQTCFSDIEIALIDNICKAKDSIKVAVAWFTNAKLLEALLIKIDEGVKVELIIRDDYINNSVDSLPWIDLVSKGGALYFPCNTKKLHHKYCIIDDATVISGSYNWTYQAERVNQEDVVIISSELVADTFSGNFELLKNGCSVLNNASLLNHRTTADAPVEEAHFFNEEVNASKDDESIEDVLIEATLHYLNKRYHYAISILSSAWNKVDNIPSAYETMAWSLARAGKSGEALSYAEKGMLLDKSNPEFHNRVFVT